MIPERPYLRDGVDVYVRGDHDLHFVFLATRKRLIVRARPALICALTWLDGQNTKSELLKRFEKEHGNEPAGGFEAFLSYLVREGIVVDPDWAESLGLDASTLEFQQRQLSFLLDVLGTPERVAEAQLRFTQVRLTCFGVGAVGSWLLRLLLGMGFRNFKLVDHALCDANDVSRHAFHSSISWEEGYPKVLATAEAMREQFPGIQVTTCNEPLTVDSTLEKLVTDDTDLVINAADEPYIGYTSVLLSRYCVPRKLPLLVAGGFDAHLASLGEMIIPNETPCADCYADYFRESLSNWVPMKHPVEERANGAGGLCSLSVFAAATAAMSVLRLFTGQRAVEGGRGELLFDRYTLESFHIDRREDCPVCGLK